MAATKPTTPMIKAKLQGLGLALNLDSTAETVLIDPSFEAAKAEIAGRGLDPDSEDLSGSQGVFVNAAIMAMVCKDCLPSPTPDTSSGLSKIGSITPEMIQSVSEKLDAEAERYYKLLGIETQRSRAYGMQTI